MSYTTVVHSGATQEPRGRSVYREWQDSLAKVNGEPDGSRDAGTIPQESVTLKMKSQTVGADVVSRGRLDWSQQPQEHLQQRSQLGRVTFQCALHRQRGQDCSESCLLPCF